MLREAQSIFVGAEFVCILSIGTGIGGVVTVGATRKSILDALKAMATSSQKVAQRLNELYSNGDVYFRFNVPRGLEDVTLSDWKEMSNISAHTRNYLAESQSPLAKCSAVLQQNSTAARNAENAMPSGESWSKKALVGSHINDRTRGQSCHWPQNRQSSLFVSSQSPISTSMYHLIATRTMWIEPKSPIFLQRN